MITLTPTRQDSSITQRWATIGDRPDAPAVDSSVRVVDESDDLTAASWSGVLTQETTYSPTHVGIDLLLGSPSAPTASDDSTPSPLQSEFDLLAAEWQEQTAFLSSPNTIAEHPAYQAILGMGERAIPMILRDLQKTQAEWFWALRFIARESPVKPENRGNIDAMTADWLDWGKRHHYI